MKQFEPLSEQIKQNYREQLYFRDPLPFGWGTNGAKNDRITYKQALSRMNSSLCYARRNGTNSCRIEVSKLGEYNLPAIKANLTKNGYEHKVIADGKRLIINTYNKEYKK